jgi:hypothetical protein
MTFAELKADYDELKSGLAEFRDALENRFEREMKRELKRRKCRRKYTREVVEEVLGDWFLERKAKYAAIAKRYIARYVNRERGIVDGLAEAIVAEGVRRSDDKALVLTVSQVDFRNQPDCIGYASVLADLHAWGVRSVGIDAEVVRRLEPGYGGRMIAYFDVMAGTDEPDKLIMFPPALEDMDKAVGFVESRGFNKYVVFPHLLTAPDGNIPTKG